MRVALTRAPGGHPFPQDKLAKEEHNSALNLNKINTQWRTVLREVKTRELHRDIEILSQTFERVLDCKDSVIKVDAPGGAGDGSQQNALMR